MDKKPAEKKPAFFVNGHPISGACWQKVVQCCRGDREQAARLFYRARFHKAANVMAWIADGLKKPEPGKGLPYALTACQDETDNAPAVRQWIDSEIYKLDGFKPVNQIMKAMFENLAKGIAA